MRLAGTVAGLSALAAFLYSPFGLLWGRTSLIEYLATAGALAFLLGAMRWLDDRRPADFVAALVAAVLAMLVKITTGAFFLVPLLAYRRKGRLVISDWSVPVLLAVPSLVGILWIRYTDALKAATPATAFQTSANMVDFNFGTPGMRVDPEVLLPIASALLIGLTGAGLLIWLPAAIAKMRQLAQGPFLATMLVSTLVGAPLVLTPLYSTQNYYPAAISPAAAILVGLGASWGWEHQRAFLGRFMLIAGTLLWIVSLVLTADYWLVSYEPVVDRDGSLAAAAFVRELTGPDDWVVIGGRNYDPTILYYANRRGYMLDPRRGTDDLAKLRADPRYTLFVDCPYEAPCTVMPEEP
jgi:hypothetical protein